MSLLAVCLGLALAADVPTRPELPAEASTTPSGAPYAVVTPGTGPTIQAGDTVQGELLAFAEDGSLLLSTKEMGAPLTFVPGSGQHAKALEEALIGAGAGARIIVDSALSEKGTPVRIAIDVVSVIPARRPPAAAPPVPESAWVTKRSGLRFADVTEGTGRTASVGDTVLVEYTGWLVDGTRFDSSLERQAPFSFTLGQFKVIRGWEEGAIGMKEGGVRVLEVPYKLAYGSAGRPPTIPPKATLIFEVRLLTVRPG